jgi:uncharacterized integral membrane protein
MMRKLVTAFILVPLLIVLVMFAVANRQYVTVSFDPFDTEHPAYALKPPLFILMFVLIAVGAVIGGISTWVGQRKWRARARRAEREVHALHEQLAERKWPPENQRALLPATNPPAPFVFPPAA